MRPTITITPPTEDSFDDLLALTAQVTGAPLIVLVVEGQAHCRLAQAGALAENLWREIRFCAEVVNASDGVAVIQDTAANKFFQAHLFVRSKPRIRFFTGTPLVTPDGRALGHLCVLGYAPQTFYTGQRAGKNRRAVRSFGFKQGC